MTVLLVFFVTLLFVYYWQNWSHPKKFPPGPRIPLPLVGDAYILDKEVYKAFCDLVKKYGNFCGFWLGGQRAVVISDFKALSDILNMASSTGRQKFAVESKYIPSLFLYIYKPKLISLISL